MSKLEKAIERLKSLPKNYTYTEAKTLLRHFGYEEDSKGRTSGSRVRFTNGTYVLDLHKPHPGDIMRYYAVKQLLAFLEEKGEI